MQLHDDDSRAHRRVVLINERRLFVEIRRGSQSETEGIELLRVPLSFKRVLQGEPGRARLFRNPKKDYESRDAYLQRGDRYSELYPFRHGAVELLFRPMIFARG